MENMCVETNEEIKNDQNDSLENNSSNETKSMSSTDYKVILDMIKEMDDQFKMIKESLENMVRDTYGLKPDVLNMILPYEKSDIPNLVKDDIREFLSRYTIEPDDDSYRTMDEEELLEIMTSVKDASLLILSSEAESKKIKEDSNDVLKDYFNYMSSDKVKKVREQRLEALKAALYNETNEINKEKIKKMINTIESSFNYSFLQRRFDLYGEKEIQSIKTSFFDTKRGSYVIDRFKAKITKFGYNPDLYKYFFNIEENFLAKKYSPFNNLFLFIYMRMVAHSDPYNKEDTLLVQSITGALANLIYHKFQSTENEQYFIDVIANIIDKFYDDVEYFKENNETYEEHPSRKEAILKYETKRKESIIKMLDELKIVGYDPNASVEELQEIYNRETEILIKKQLNSKDDDGEELVIEEAETVEESSEVSTDDIKEESDSEEVTE